LLRVIDPRSGAVRRCAGRILDTVLECIAKNERRLALIPAFSPLGVYGPGTWWTHLQKGWKMIKIFYSFFTALLVIPALLLCWLAIEEVEYFFAPDTREETTTVIKRTDNPSIRPG
jgi:hypothetical protein